MIYEHWNIPPEATKEIQFNFVTMWYRETGRFKLLNEYIKSKLDDLEKDGGYSALKKEEEKVALYIQRCSSDPGIYGDMQDRKDYLDEIRNRLKKFNQ